MDNKSKISSVRMSQELYTRIKDTAVRTGATVGETIRHACRQFDEKDAQVNKVLKILAESTASDLSNIYFYGNNEYVTNKMSLYRHEQAATEIKELGETVNDTIMKFMQESMSNGTLLSKGKIETSDGTNIISFRVNIFNVYCQIGPGQITILSVT